MSNKATEISEALLKHDIDLLRLSAGTSTKIQKILAKLREKLVTKIKRVNPGAQITAGAKNKYVSALVTSTDKDIDRAYKTIKELTGTENSQLAVVQATIAGDVMNASIGVDLVSGRLSANVLESLAGKALMEGAPSAEWWALQSDDMKQGFKNQMREGVIAGESIDELARRVKGSRTSGFQDGLLGKFGRKANTLVRSSVLSVANEARLATFQQNSDVIKGVQWTSTLDSRTSEICMALDNQAWTLDRKRMPGTTHAWRGPPPAHFNCRSTLTPILRSWSDLSNNPAIKQKLQAAEAKIGPGFRASMDGQVPADLTYEDWLKTKPEAFQIDVLGPKKHKLWKKGKLPFTNLIDQRHNPLTIEQLTNTSK